MKRPSLGILFASALALSTAGACSIKSETAPSRFYLLRPLPADAVETTTSGAEAGPVLALGPVVVPAYLDRPQIVTQAPGAEVKLSEFERWAEPLRDNISTVLADNLTRLVPTNQVSPYPGRLQRDTDLRIEVDILRFDGPLGGEIVLDARWSLIPGTEEASVRSQRSRFVERAAGPDYTDLVDAMSRTLDALSRELSREIRRAVGGS